MRNRLALCLSALLIACCPLATEAAASPAPAALPRFEGTTVDDFWLAQAAPGAITEVPDPAGSGETVFRFTVGDKDETGPQMPNPRAELLSPDRIRSGAEFWWSGKFLLPRSFPGRVPGWLNLMQGPFGKPWRGSPAWSIKVSGRWIEWQRNLTYDWDVPWRMPLVRGRWIRVLGHTRFGSRGYVEMWIDGRRVSFFEGSTWNPHHHPETDRLRMRTRDDSNDAAPNSMYLQSYRKRGMFNSVTLYQGPLQIGPTRASVAPSWPIPIGGL